MPVRSIQFSFAGGELTPRLGGRVDLGRYFTGVETCLNYQTLPTGGVRRRPGTQFIATTKHHDRVCRLERFEFSVVQAYILEIGHEYIRFYRDLGRLEVAGVPVEVTTPYQEDDLFDLQMTQSADVLYLVHPAYPPAKLLRLGDTTWEYKPIIFRPQPAFEADTDLGTTLQPGARTGTGVTFTAGSAVFLDGDIDRQIVAGDSRAIITALPGASPSATATCTIINDFPSTAVIAAGAWVLTGSPAVSITPDKTGPVGALVTVLAERVLESQPELIDDGDFSGGQGSWVDLSAPTLGISGSTTSGGDTALNDTGATFQSDGVQVGHRAKDTGTNLRDRIDNVTSETSLQTASGGATWGIATPYELFQAGVATFSGGEATLNSQETNGIAWIQRQIVTIPDRRYRLEFTIREAPLSVQIGTTTGASDILAEVSYDVGNDQSLSFTATSATTFIQFRNNQPVDAILDDVSCKNASAQAFRTADIGKLILVSGGVIEITRRINALSVEGVVWAILDNTSSAIAGAWVLGVPAWSATQGYPRALSFHEGRLWFFSTSQQPLTGWASVVGDYENFAVGILQDDSLEVTISANTMNTIEWAEPFRDLFLGTRGGEHIITGGNSPISPENLAQSPQDTEGSPPFRPLRTGNVLMHLQRGRRKVRELTIEADTGLTRARDVTLIAEHITRSGIRQWAFQRQPVRTIWAVRMDGVLIGFTFELLEDVRGWHRHTTPGGAFESVAVLPVDEGETEETEQLWCVVRRTTIGSDARYIEVFRPAEETDTTQQAELTLDCALCYNGTPATTFSGLSHLEGQTVRLVARDTVTVTTLTGDQVVTDRLSDLGTQKVVLGQVTTTAAVSRLDVGLHFTSKLLTVRPELQASDGTLQFRKKRWVTLYARLLQSRGLYINGQEVPPQSTSDFFDTGLTPHDIDVMALGTGWDTAGRVTFEQRLPYPSHIVCVAGDLEYEEVE